MPTFVVAVWLEHSAHTHTITGYVEIWLSDNIESDQADIEDWKRSEVVDDYSERFLRKLHPGRLHDHQRSLRPVGGIAFLSALAPVACGDPGSHPGSSERADRDQSVDYETNNVQPQSRLDIP